MGQKQRDWLTAFEAEMFKINPVWIGRIHWPTAKQYYRAGYTPAKAAEFYETLSKTYANPKG